MKKIHLFFFAVLFSCIYPGYAKAGEPFSPNTVLSILDYGGIPNSSTTASRNANVAAFSAMEAAAVSNQLTIIPEGDWYFNATLEMSSSVKVFNLMVIGNTFFTGSGFELEGQGHYLDVKGAITGSGTGATDSTGYASYSGNGIMLKNAYNCTVTFGLIKGFNAGVKAAGVGAVPPTSPKGSQYNSVTGSYIRNCYAQIFVSTLGATSGTPPTDLGNWSNSNVFNVTQIGTPGRGTGGTFGVLMRKDPSSSQASNNPFNYNSFYVGIEGAYIAIWAENAEHNLFFPTRWEAPQIANGIYLRQDNTGGLGCFYNKVDGSPLNESAWMTNGYGISTDFPGATDANGGLVANKVLPISGGVMNFVGEEPFSMISTNPMVSFDFQGQNILRQRYFAHMIRNTNGVTLNRYVEFSYKPIAISGATYTVAADIGEVFVTPVANSYISLPTPSSWAGRKITIRSFQPYSPGVTSRVTMNPTDIQAGDPTQIPAGEAITYEAIGTVWAAIARYTRL